MEIERSPGRFEGAFNGYVVYGTLFRDPVGKKLWLLNLTRGWSEEHESTDHHYWVDGDEFREAGGSLLEGSSRRSGYLRGAVVAKLDSAERKAALEAIGAWETATAS